MSLKHLYIDLNSLGIYPDLIIQSFMEPSGDVKCEPNMQVVIPNKYYGRKVYNHLTVCIRKTHSQGIPEAHMSFITRELGHQDLLAIVIQGTDTFTVRWKHTGINITYNGRMREVSYPKGRWFGSLFLLNLRDVKSLDGLEEALKMSTI